jgi:hypothetical protein
VKKRTYVFFFVPMLEDWVAHASRVLATASPLSRTPYLIVSTAAFDQQKDRFGETPKPARETRAPTQRSVLDAVR